MNLEIVKCTSHNFAIEITDPSGAPYAPRTGDVVIFGIQKRSTREILIVKTAKVEPSGMVNITFKPEDTKELRPDRYFYDVGLKTGNDYYMIVPLSEIVIRENVTDKEMAYV